MTVTGDPSGAKILRVGVLTAMPNLDPRSSQDFVGAFVLSQVFDSPFADAGEELDTLPVLFTEPLRQEAGGMACSAAVRHDVTFSDGTPMTAEDVARSIAAMPSIRGRAQVEPRGDRVHFALSNPDPRFDVALAHQCPVWKESGHSLLGTGAFCIAADSTPTAVRLERNPHYREPVSLDGIHFDVYPPDPDGRPRALLAALDSGEVDFTNVLSRNDVERVAGARKRIKPGLSTAMLYFNLDSPALGDVRVRRALAHAIDRLAIAKASYANPLAFRAMGLLPRPMGSSDDGIFFDLRQAKELLAAPGVHKPERLSLLLPWGPRPHLPHPGRTAELIVQQFGELGIHVDLVQTDTSADYFRKTASLAQDLVLSGWVADTPDPADFFEAIVSSRAIPTSERSRFAGNLSRWRNQAADDAIGRYRSQRSDADRDEVLRLVAEDVPLLPLMYGPAIFVYSFRVHHFEPSALGIVPLHRIDLRA